MIMGLPWGNKGWDAVGPDVLEAFKNAIREASAFQRLGLTSRFQSETSPMDESNFCCNWRLTSQIRLYLRTYGHFQCSLATCVSTSTKMVGSRCVKFTIK